MRRGAGLLMLSLLACGPDSDLRDYYFPVRELAATGQVYQYATTGSLQDEEHEYWYYLGIDLDTALYLSATRYAADGTTPDQLDRQRLTNEGVFLEALTVHPRDSLGRPVRTQAEVLYDRIFSFDPADGRPTGYRLRYPTGGAQVYVSLDRRYRSDTTVNVLGEERPAVVFDLIGEVSERDPVLGDISPTFTGYEIYAEGLGLVEYARDLGAAGTLGGRLVRRMGMGEYAGR